MNNTVAMEQPEVYDNDCNGTFSENNLNESTKPKSQHHKLRENSKDELQLKKNRKKKKSTTHTSSCSESDNLPSNISEFISTKGRKYKKSTNNHSDPEVLNASDMISSNSITESPDIAALPNTDDMKSKTENKVLSPTSTKSPNSKVNAFQFMMNSRFNVIGSNSEGKDREDTDVTDDAIFEKRRTLHKRKAVFENWAEQKSPAAKRKLQDEAQEKFIARTLSKRAKRMKKMLSISNNNRPDGGADADDSNDSEINIGIKSAKSVKSILTDSESSNDAGVSGATGNASSKITGKHLDVVAFSNEVVKNFNQKIVKRNCLDDFVVKQDTSPNTDNVQIEIRNAVQVKRKEEEDKDVIKVRLTFTPRRAKFCAVTTQENTPQQKSKRVKKNRKSSLSLKKTEESVQLRIDSAEGTAMNQALNRIDNDDDDDDDDEIFPTKADVNKTPLSMKVKTDERKISSNGSLVEIDSLKENNGKSAPRSWKMKVKLLEKENENVAESDACEIIVISNHSPKTDASDVDVIDVESFSNSSASSVGRKQVKLAPIFLKNSKKLDQASLEAKKNFLHSGLPSSVKKSQATQLSEQEISYEIFPTISHVQQKEPEDPLAVFWNLPEVLLALSGPHTDSPTKSYYDEIYTGSFTTCRRIVNIPVGNKQTYASPGKLKNISQLIRALKSERPDYPVYKMFRLLQQKSVMRNNRAEFNTEQTNLIEKTKEIVVKKRARGRPRKNAIIPVDAKPPLTVSNPAPMVLRPAASASASECMWTEQYKPQSSHDIVGNFKVVHELKLWLESWVAYSEDKRSRKRKRLKSDSSDDFRSDSDTRDTDNSAPLNTLLLTGPHGSGKTAATYALCNELNINVIEINASSKRTGKRVLSDLQEATQSHQVKNTDAKSVNGFFHKTADARSDDDSNTKLSLLLVEDVDIVFEDHDEGLISALATLTSTSKRPIILTSADPASVQVQRFRSQHRAISFSAPSAAILGTWLQILCLVEGVHVSNDAVVRLLRWNKGDVRRTILQLQFWVQSGGDPLRSGSSDVKTPSKYTNDVDGFFYHDEASDLPWLLPDDIAAADGAESSLVHQDCIQCFVPYYERDKPGFQIPYPVRLGLLWWNVPGFLGFCPIKHTDVIETRDDAISTNDNKLTDFSGVINQMKQAEIVNKVTKETDMDDASGPGTDIRVQNPVKQKCTKELEDLQLAISVLDTIAFADTVYKNMQLDYDSEPVANYWSRYPADSLSFKENMDPYDDSHNLSLDIAHWLLETTLRNCEAITNRKFVNADANVALPDSDIVRWRTRHHRAMDEISSVVPSSALLDRKGVCTDYHSTIRSISRIENARFNSNSKRKNRFYHYFKSMNVHFTDSTFRVINNSLAINKDTI